MFAAYLQRAPPDRVNLLEFNITVASVSRERESFGILLMARIIARNEYTLSARNEKYPAGKRATAATRDARKTPGGRWKTSRRNDSVGRRFLSRILKKQIARRDTRGSPYKSIATRRDK